MALRFPYQFVKVEKLRNIQAAYQKLLTSNLTATSFIKEIEAGNLDASFQAEADTEEGLAKALLSMQHQLQKIAEEEKERNWATQGVALFAEILRSNNSDAKAFYQHIISKLVKYTRATQGGLFLVNDQDKKDITIELVACYAYSRQKYLTKKMKPGEGLVGQCFLEKETIFMTDLPQNYVEITSGLGTANPSCLVIVPLKVNEEVHGFVELASFEVFKPFEIEFLKKLGESIASSISTVKINQRTRHLLEESQQQAEEMRAQEEEMRQNMEELQAIHESQARMAEELQLNEAELKKQVDALAAARAEVESVRKLEQERAEQRVVSQRKATEKAVMKFKENEQLLKQEIEKLKAELNHLKNNQA